MCTYIYSKPQRMQLKHHKLLLYGISLYCSAAAWLQGPHLKHCTHTRQPEESYMKVRRRRQWVTREGNLKARKWCWVHSEEETRHDVDVTRPPLYSLAPLTSPPSICIRSPPDSLVSLFISPHRFPRLAGVQCGIKLPSARCQFGRNLLAH